MVEAWRGETKLKIDFHRLPGPRGGVEHLRDSYTYIGEKPQAISDKQTRSVQDR
jgi:hypothetical protein